MKKLFSRYAHWFALVIIGFSVMTMFMDYSNNTLNLIAIIMGIIALLSIGYLTFEVERRIRKKKEER